MITKKIFLASSSELKEDRQEFETAFGEFRATNRPVIFVYFKDVEISTGSANKKELISVWSFQEKLDALGHFQTTYKTIDGLKLHFTQQLDKLAETGFFENASESEGTELSPTPADVQNASLTGHGAIAQGAGAVASQTTYDTGGGAMVFGNVDTGGGSFHGRDVIIQNASANDLERLFAPLVAAVVTGAPRDALAGALQQVEALKVEIARG